MAIRFGILVNRTRDFLVLVPLGESIRTRQEVQVETRVTEAEPETHLKCKKSLPMKKKKKKQTVIIIPLNRIKTVFADIVQEL